MEFELEDFSAFLKECIMPVVNYSRIGSMVEPVITIEAEKNMIRVSSSQHNRLAETTIPAKVTTKGKVHALSSTLTSLRSKHKRVEVSDVNSKLMVTSLKGETKLEISMDTVTTGSTASIKTSKKSVALQISSKKMKDIMSKVSIVPIVVPGREEALISLFKEGKYLNCIVQDSSRLVFYKELNKKIDIPEVTTSLAEIQSIMAVSEALSDDIDFAFGKKAIEATGINEGKSNTFLKTNYTAPNDYMLARALTVYKEIMATEDIASFEINESFLNVLETVVSLTNSRTKQSHLDLSLSSKRLDIAGLGPLSSYKESIKHKVKGTGCTVKIASKIFSDILRYFKEDNTTFSIKPKAIVVQTKAKKKITTFILPFLSLK